MLEWPEKRKNGLPNKSGQRFPPKILALLQKDCGRDRKKIVKGSEGWWKTVKKCHFLRSRRFLGPYAINFCLFCDLQKKECRAFPDIWPPYAERRRCLLVGQGEMLIFDQIRVSPGFPPQ